jgi:hypothetical protein
MGLDKDDNKSTQAFSVLKTYFRECWIDTKGKDRELRLKIRDMARGRKGEGQ